MGRKRSRLERVKYFKAPFCKENYLSHHMRMHGAKWIEYCGLDLEAKKTFFDIGSSSRSHAMMHAFSRPRVLPLRLLINKDIINVIIGNMMFHPEDKNGISRSHLLSSFAPTLDLSENAADAGNISWYAIIINNTK